MLLVFQPMILSAVINMLQVEYNNNKTAGPLFKRLTNGPYHKHFVQYHGLK